MKTVSRPAEQSSYCRDVVWTSQ